MYYNIYYPITNKLYPKYEFKRIKGIEGAGGGH